MKTYTVEFYDRYQGTREIHIEAESPEQANEIFIRSMGMIPTGIHLLA
jgi:hypothetical protein